VTHTNSQSVDEISTHGITRRRFLHGAARWGLAVGVGLASPVAFFHQRASATTCSVYGTTPTWGSSCRPETPICSSCTSTGKCGTGTRPRCNAWTTAESDGQYCWCSTSACRAGCIKGYYVCCDCWESGSGGCGSGSGPCLCRHLHVTCQGPQCGCGTICPESSDEAA